jgi:membrane protein YqaA with SNARE-associated domain
VSQAEQNAQRRSWWFYLFASLAFLLLLLLVVVAVLFREQIQQAQAYGYAGVFVVGILCGFTIIPAPTLLMVFTMGGVLNPLYVGLVAGFGAAVGGITVYMTGAGMGTIWSKLRPRQETTSSLIRRNTRLSRSKLWVKAEAFYNQMVKWMEGKGGSWTLFITSAMIISPFYFAGIAAGSLRIGLLRFFLISWAGKTIRYITVAFAGYWGLTSLLKWIGS